MEQRWYVFKVLITSNGSEERSLTPYDDHDTALRKWHECFNTIGGGPKFISATLLDRYMNQDLKHTDWWEAPSEDIVEE